MNGTEVQIKMTGRTVEVELVYSSSVLFCWLCRSVLRYECCLTGLSSNVTGKAVMCVPQVMIKEWFVYGILRLIDRTEEEPTLGFVMVARPYEIS